MDAEHNRDFLNWIEENHFIDSYFAVYKDTLLAMLKDEVPESRYKDVCAAVPDVLGRCDQIEYNSVQVTAYIIIHLLDRYYRFWLIYCQLIEKGLFPDKPQMRMMDIGTGPGPSMYAYSDIMWLISRYKEANGLKPSRISIDYVEKAEGFRQFLHHYTERSQLANHPTCVPFHHGTYSDAIEFDLTGTVTQYNYFAIWDELNQKHIVNTKSFEQYVAQSFNLIVYSNFLTNLQTVNDFANQIAKAAFWLRNRGLLVVVGCNPADEKYRPVYEKIDQIISGQPYTNRDFVGGCKRVISQERMFYNPLCPVALQMGEFHNEIFDLLTQGDHSRVSGKLWNLVEKEKVGVGNETDWWITVYRRHSRLRHQ